MLIANRIVENHLTFFIRYTVTLYHFLAGSHWVAFVTDSIHDYII